jgi:hypothetical protein
MAHRQSRSAGWISMQPTATQSSFCSESGFRVLAPLWARRSTTRRAAPRSKTSSSGGESRVVTEYIQSSSHGERPSAVVRRQHTVRVTFVKACYTAAPAEPRARTDHRAGQRLGGNRRGLARHGHPSDPRDSIPRGHAGQPRTLGRGTSRPVLVVAIRTGVVCLYRSDREYLGLRAARVGSALGDASDRHASVHLPAGGLHLDAQRLSSSSSMNTATVVRAAAHSAQEVTSARDGAMAAARPKTEASVPQLPIRSSSAFDVVTPSGFAAASNTNACAR